MCGFAGIIAWDDRFRADRAALEGLSACIAHRGPDAQGLHLERVQLMSGRPAEVGLVHRRLAILDLDPRADQPFADGRGRWIVFNGEIYNFRELREELARLRPGYAWRTNCDTEVLLLACDVWGVEALRRLDGMFAFALWDPHAGDGGQVLLARDRMGQKPLYYAEVPGQVVAFASEPAALRRLPWVDSSLRMEIVADYLTWGWTPRGTIHRGIEKLAPAQWRCFNPRGTESGTYFRANDPVPAPTPPEPAVVQTRRLVLDAVRRQLVSDVPVGCFLSGGIDSSIVAAAMVHAAGKTQPVLTFSIGFADPRYDETAYAAAVARHLGTQHRQFTVQPNAAEDLPRLAAIFGEPFGDSSALPTHYLARETRRHVKVALSGDGGDELFGGYDRYRAMAMGGAVQKLPALVRALVQRLPGSHPKSRIARLKRLLASAHLPPGQRYASYLQLFDAATVAQLLSPYGGQAASWAAASAALVAERYDRLRSSAGDGRGMRDEVEAALAVDRELYLSEDLLTKVDRCSMLHALEVRSPFMDPALVHFAATLPTDLLIRSASKRLLRDAFAPDLPPGLFNRPKMGFAVPIGEWFRSSLRAMLRDTLSAADSFARVHLDQRCIQRLIEEHESQRTDHSQRLYALLMLELWWQGHPA